MKIGILVNLVTSEDTGQTTYRVGARLSAAGHEVWVIQAGSFACDPDGTLRARAVRAVGVPSASHDDYVRALHAKDALREWISVARLDVLWLRSNPSVLSPWARYSTTQFGMIAARQGVLVLNDPFGLARAANKLYLMRFPEPVRPVTLVTRDKRQLDRFIEERGKAVLKPLDGSGGRGVFLAEANDLNQEAIFHALLRDGYVMAQEYVPAAAEGDTRLFLLDGVPLVHQGRCCAFRRIRSGDDLRSNIHAGGKLRRANVGPTELALAEQVREQLVSDGMFLVGLDIAGDKLMEINVFSPGGLGSAQLFEKVDFTVPLQEAIEQRWKAHRSARRG
jgi:glutathione synthase